MRRAVEIVNEGMNWMQLIYLRGKFATEPGFELQVFCFLRWRITTELDFDLVCGMYSGTNFALKSTNLNRLLGYLRYKKISIINSYIN